MAPHVYIFDTDSQYSALLNGICRTTDMHSAIFNDASDFLEQVPEEGILVLDLKMSFCDGIGIIKKLSTINSKLKLILMSSYDLGVLKAAKVLADSHNVSVVACLRKPILVSSFRQALEQAAYCCSQSCVSEDELQVC